MPNPKKKQPAKGFDGPIIGSKKKPGEDFEVPVFKDKPDAEFEVPVFKDKPPLEPNPDKP